jgi:hypothetical protein
VLPGIPSNEKNSFDHHNSYNKGPNLALFSFTESPSNSLPTIKFPKNHIASSYHRNLPKTTNAISVHQRVLGVKCQSGHHPQSVILIIHRDSLDRFVSLAIQSVHKGVIIPIVSFNTSHTNPTTPHGHHPSGFFFWQQIKGGINFDWCIYGGNHSHILEKGLCCPSKKKPCHPWLPL